MTLTEEILKRVRGNKRIFVETGTYLGQGVSCALAVGFERIFSIELYENRYKECVEKFKAYKQVQILRGNSGVKLGELLDTEIHEPVVFWLDSHYDAFQIEPDYPIPFGDTQPILSELTAIQSHSIRTHTILIDDRRIFALKKKVPRWHNITEEILLKRLCGINPKYTISYLDSSCFEKDIIVAEVL